MSETTPQIRRARLRLALLLLLVVALALAVMAALRLRALQPPKFRGTAYHDDVAAPALALTAHDGRRVTLESFRGRPVLLFFGYTHCPDVCPMTLSRLARVREELGGPATDAEVVLVTLDPARDTPAVLAEYVRRFAGGRGITALTGDSAALAAARGGYGAYVLPGSEGPRPVEAGHGGHAPSLHGGKPHTSAVYGIDRAGRLRVVISEQATEEETRDDVRTLARL